jgi:hypothetical protein
VLTQFDVGGDNSEDQLILPVLGVTTKDTLLIRKITGLNPADVTLFMGDYSGDGGIYQGRRVGNRNIVATIDLNPNPALGETVSSLRQLLQKAFLSPMPDMTSNPPVHADYIKFQLHDDDGNVRYIVGYTEKFETEIFDVETTAQVSIICPDPFIRDNEETDLTDSSGWSTLPIVYYGSAPTGFYAKIYMNSSSDILTLENLGQKMIFDWTGVAGTLSAGETIHIWTTRGSRDARYQIASNPTVPMVSYMTPDSTWLELRARSNSFKVYGATTSDLPAVIKQFKYTQAYWGI